MVRKSGKVRPRKENGSIMHQMISRSCLVTLSAAGLLLGAATSPAEPAAWWNFDEQEGHIVRDVTGNGHDGVIHGDVVRAAGVSGGALQFPGDTSAYVSVENKEGLDFTTAMTIEAWVKRTDTGSRWDGILSNAWGSSGYQIFYGANTQAFTLYLHTDERSYAPVTGVHIPISEWMHLAVVYDAGEGFVRLYQNGRQTAQSAWTGTITNYPEEFYIGRAIGRHFDGFRGLLDEVKLYGRALSPEEIAAGYEVVAAGLPAPSDPLEPVFRNAEAKRDGDVIRVTFERLPDSSFAPEDRLTIYRSSYPRNDHVPGALAEGEVVFQGTLESEDGIHFEYVDDTGIEPGVTYYYWPTPDGENFRIFRAHVRVRHPEIWWTPERIDQEIDAVAERFADKLEVRQVGETVEGRPLRALYAGNPDRRIVLIGAVHVSESGPELIIPALAGVLEERPELLEEVGIAALPCVTLDEREWKLAEGYPRYLRTNANGVDLNRNFDARWRHAIPAPGPQTYQGEEPGSEPETQAIMALLRESNPLTVLDFHSVGSLANAFFLYSGFAEVDSNTGYLEQSREVAEVYTEAMYGEGWEEYLIFRGSPNFGTVGSWVYEEFGVPSFSLELDNHPEPVKYVHADALPLEMLEEYQVRHRDGIIALMEAFANGVIPEHYEDRE